jgi:hypothetical protein
LCDVSLKHGNELQIKAGMVQRCLGFDGDGWQQHGEMMGCILDIDLMMDREQRGAMMGEGDGCDVTTMGPAV